MRGIFFPQKRPSSALHPLTAKAPCQGPSSQLPSSAHHHPRRKGDPYLALAPRLSSAIILQSASASANNSSKSKDSHVTTSRMAGRRHATRRGFPTYWSESQIDLGRQQKNRKILVFLAGGRSDLVRFKAWSRALLTSCRGRGHRDRESRVHADLHVSRRHTLTDVANTSSSHLNNEQKLVSANKLITHRRNLFQ